MSDTIIYFKNGIGNLIMHSPAIQALASMDSTGKVDYCLDSEWKDSRVTGIINILENWDIINDIIFYPKQNIKKKYKLWFYTMHSEGSKAWDLFRQHKLILNKINWRESMLHETEYYMNIVRKLGYKGPTPKKYVPMADEPMIKKNGKKVVGFCGGYFPTQYWHKKGWPYFKDCVKTLKLYYKIDTVKIGIKNELKDIACDYDYVNKLSFVETAKVISQLDLLITTDTSCMHVADALDIPSISLFGSTFVFKSGPLNRMSHVIVSKAKCRPCQSSKQFFDCKDYKCMESISIGDIINKIRDEKLL